MAEKVASFRLKEYKINKASIEFDPDKKMSSMHPVKVEGNYRFYKK